MATCTKLVLNSFEFCSIYFSRVRYIMIIMDLKITSSYSSTKAFRSHLLRQQKEKNDCIQMVFFLYCKLYYTKIHQALNLPSLTIPRATPGDSHILVAPGVWFSLLCLAQGSAPRVCPRGVLNQSKSSKKARFLLCLLDK